MLISKYEGGRDEEVLEIFEKTLLASPYEVSFNKDYWANWLQEVVRYPNLYTIILAEDKSKIVGVLVGQIYFGHPLVQFSRIAMEMFWYVEAEFRGKNSIKMMHMYEEWASKVGATHVCMSSLANEHQDKLHNIYVKKGYVPLETQYIKVIDNAED